MNDNYDPSIIEKNAQQFWADNPVDAPHRCALPTHLRIHHLQQSLPGL